MIVKTRNYKLEKSKYIRIALQGVLRQQWWVGLIVVAVSCGYLWIPSMWWFIGILIAASLYLLFWWLQFYGLSQLEQGKMLFNRYRYEISSQQILIKLTPREGMPVKWAQIKRARVGKSGFILFLSKAQIIYLPFKIFNTENERKFLSSILRAKSLIK